MSAVRETIELVDQFSPVIENIVGSINYAVTAMEQMAKSMNFQIDGSALESARAQTDRLNDSMRLFSGAANDAGKQVGTFNDDVKKISGTASETESGINKLNDTMKKTAGETAEIKSDINKLDDTMKQVSGSVDELGKSADSAGKEVDGFGKSTDGAEKEIAQLQNRLNAAERETAQFQNSLNAAEKEITELQNRFNAAEKETARLQNSLNAAEKEITQLKEKIEGLEDEVGGMGGKFGNASSSINDLFVALGGYKVLGFVKSAFTETTSAAMEFESAVTGIYKTVDGSAQQLAGLSDAVKQMAIEIPSTTTEIAGVMESAGQLGIDTKNIESFTRTIIDLSNSTNLSTEAAATSLAQFANITNMSASQYQNLGSAIVDLGNNFATTETDIVEMSSHLASAAHLAGFTEPDILALSTAMSSVGINAEAGASSMSTLITRMQLAVETGDDLEDFAEVADMSMRQFSDTFENNAVGALQAFITGLNDVERTGSSASAILKEMDLDDVRLSNTIRSLAGNETLLSSAVSTASQAWNENTALTNEASKRYETLESKMQTTKNAADKFKTAIGSSLTPALDGLSGAAKGLLSGMGDLVDKFPALTAGLTSHVGTFITVSAGFAAFTSTINTVKTAWKALDTTISLSKVGLAIGVLSAAVGIGTTIYTHFKKAKDSIEDYNGTLEQCRNEMERTQDEYIAVCQRYGENSAAAQKLTGDIDTLNAQYQKGGGVVSDYAQRLEENQEKLNSFMDEYDNKIKPVNDEWQNGMIATAQLEALSQKTQLTNTDLDMMSKYADYLNDTFNCNIEVNYNTKSLTGFNPNDINSQMERLARESTQNYAQEALSSGELSVGYIDAVRELDEFTKLSKDKIREDLETIGGIATEDEIQQILEKDKDYAATYQGYIDNVNGYRKKLYDLTDMAGYDSDGADTFINSLDDIANGFDNVSESAANFPKTIEESTGFDSAKGIMEEYTEQILNLATSYDEAYNSALESMQGQFGLFDEASMKSKEYMNSTVSNAQEALESQLAYWESYGANIDYMKNVTAVDLGVTQQQYDAFMEYVRTGTPEAAGLLNDMVGKVKEGNTEAVTNVIQTQGKITELQDSIATDIGKWASGIDEEMQEVYNKMESKINDLDLSVEAGRSASNTMSSYIASISDAKSTAVVEAQSVVGAVKSVFQNANLSFTAGGVSGSVSGNVSGGSVPGHAKGTTNAEDIFIAGEEGPELIVGKQGSTVFPNSETNRILSAISGFNNLNEYSAANRLESKIINNYNSLQSNFNDSNIIKVLGNIDDKISKFNSGLLPSDVIVDLSFLDNIVSKFKADNNEKFQNVINYNDYFNNSEMSFTNDYSRNYDENFTSVSQALNSDDEPYRFIYPVENNQYSETVSRKEIIIKFEGGEEIAIPKNSTVNESEILELMFKYAKPVFANILSTEILEEGESSYDY